MCGGATANRRPGPTSLAASPVNFIRDDRKASGSEAASCHIYLSWTLRTLLAFHRCAARVFYDLPFCHGEQSTMILCPLYLTPDTDAEPSGLPWIGVREWATR
jgi:hypothetical protein